MSDQGLIDLVDLLNQCFGAAAGAECAVERLGQRGEAGDIGQQRRAGTVLRQLVAPHNCVDAILWQVGSKRLLHWALLETSVAQRLVRWWDDRSRLRARQQLTAQISVRRAVG